MQKSLFFNRRQTGKRLKRRHGMVQATSWLHSHGTKLLVALLVLTLLLTYATTMLYFWNRVTGNMRHGLHDLSSPVAIPTKAPVRPKLILHVGPPKTATSSMQHMLFKLKEELKRDNYYFLGRYSMDADVRWSPEIQPFQDANCAPVSFFWTNDDDETPPRLKPGRCWDMLMQHLDLHYLQGHNVLVSDEVISIQRDIAYGAALEDFAFIQKALAKWDVRILVGYRRYFDWIRSSKSEYDFRLTYLNFDFAVGDFDKWPGGKYDATEAEPGELQPVAAQLREMWEQHQEHPYPYTSETLEPFEILFPGKVLTFSMHNDDFFGQIVCELIPDARHTCRAHRDHKYSPSMVVLNTQFSSFYDMLAVEAFKANKLDRSDPPERLDMAQCVKYYNEDILKRTTYDFPLICPDKEDMLPLLNISLEHERNLVPRMVDDAAHREAFWRAFHSHKYCTIDAKSALEDPTWCQFFDNTTYWLPICAREIEEIIPQ